MKIFIKKKKSKQNIQIWINNYKEEVWEQNRKIKIKILEGIFKAVTVTVLKESTERTKKTCL